MDLFGFISNNVYIFGCGMQDKGSSDIDIQMQKIDGFYSPLFVGYPLTGIWIQYEYDENNQPKVNGLGVDYRYQFDGYGQVSLNLSIIDQWIPLGEYSINDTGTQISFHEGNNSKLLTFVADENGTCLKIAKYTIDNNSSSLENNFAFCKEF